jgi:hypothetical protein
MSQMQQTLPSTRVNQNVQHVYPCNGRTCVRLYGNRIEHPIGAPAEESKQDEIRPLRPTDPGVGVVTIYGSIPHFYIKQR